MSKRLPGSERTREALSDSIAGRLSSEVGRSELVRLAPRHFDESLTPMLVSTRPT
jgi:hypothetical protein